MGLLKCLRETAKRLVRRTNKGSGHERQFNCHKYNGPLTLHFLLPCSGPKQKWLRQRHKQKQSPSWLVKRLIHLRAIPRTLMLWHCKLSLSVSVCVCSLLTLLHVSVKCNCISILYFSLVRLIRLIFRFKFFLCSYYYVRK